MKDKIIYLTQFYYNNELLFIYYDLLEQKFSTYDANGLNVTIFDKLLNKKNDKNLFCILNRHNFSKIIASLMIASSILLTPTQIKADHVPQIYSEPFPKTNSSYKITMTEKIQKIIENYNLYDIANQIFQNPKEFLAMFEAVSSNETIPYSNQRIFFLAFPFYLKYKNMIDLDFLCSKIKMLVIDQKEPTANDSILASIQIINKLIQLNYYIDEDNKEYKPTAMHEIFHIYSIDKNYMFLSTITYSPTENVFKKGTIEGETELSLNQTGILLEEGCAELLSMEYINNLDSHVYQFYTSIVKMLCETFKTDTIISSLLEENGIVHLANNLIALDYSYEEILNFLLSLDFWTDINSLEIGKIETDDFKYFLCEKLIDIYERKTGNDYKNNLNFLVALNNITSSIFSNHLLENFSLENLKYPELYQIIKSRKNAVTLGLEGIIDDDAVIVEAKTNKKYFVKESNTEEYLYLKINYNDVLYDIKIDINNNSELVKDNFIRIREN